MTSRNNAAQSGTDGGFNMQSRKKSLANAKDPRKPLAMRVYFAALSRMDKYGHASFDRSELRDVLTTVDTKTGEVITPTRVGVSKAVRTAREQGLVMPESNVECLVIDPDEATYLRADERGRYLHRCAKHGKGDLMS